MASLQSCGPCSGYVSRSVYNITATQIQQWLPQANKAGKAYGMNPAALLAFASIETNGQYNAVDPTGTSYGIVQIGQGFVTAYNCSHGCTYKLTDMAAQGPNITDAATAVQISFYILAQYLYTINTKTQEFVKTATGWNGAMCGENGSATPYGSACGGWPVPANPTCYGEAILQLASAYGPWWKNPSTGIGDSFYFGDLASVSPSVLPTLTNVNYGP